MQSKDENPNVQMLQVKSKQVSNPTVQLPPPQDMGHTTSTWVLSSQPYMSTCLQLMPRCKKMLEMAMGPERSSVPLNKHLQKASVLLVTHKPPHPSGLGHWNSPVPACKHIRNV